MASIMVSKSVPSASPKLSSPSPYDLADAAANRLLNRLQHSAKHHQSIAHLALILSRCDSRHSCDSGVCPRCNHSYQRQFTSAVSRFTTAQPDHEYYAISIILPASYIPAGQLRRFDLTKYKRSLRHYLGKAGCGLLFGVIEFDFIEHSTVRYPAGWLPHLHGLVAAFDLKALKGRFKAAIACTEAVPRPVKLKEWDGQKKWLRYCSKISLKRRVGFDALHRYHKQTGKMRLCRGTKTRKLRSKELRELARCQHRLPLTNRLFAYRVQWRTQGFTWHLVRLR
jgi:hypothetical protein